MLADAFRNHKIEYFVSIANTMTADIKELDLDLNPRYEIGEKILSVSN